MALFHDSGDERSRQATLTNPSTSAILAHNTNIEPDMAKKERFKRTRGWFSRGKDYGREVVNADQIQSEWGSIKDMAGKVLRPSKAEGREETFDNAMSRLKLTEEDIRGSYKFHVVRLYIFTVGLGVAFITSLVSVFNGSWMQAIACLGVAAAMAALSFQASFRAFQIRRRELFDVSFWLENPREWIPKSLDLPARPRSKSNLPARRSNHPSRPSK